MRKGTLDSFGLRDRTADSDILLAAMSLAWDSDGSLGRWVKKARGQAFEKGRIKAGLTTETKAASDCSINRRKLSFSTTPLSVSRTCGRSSPNDSHWARSKTHYVSNKGRMAHFFRTTTSWHPIRTLGLLCKASRNGVCRQWNNLQQGRSCNLRKR